MHGMGCGGESDIQAKLQVLEEIKELMDSRLGDKMAPKEVAVEKVSLGEDVDMDEMSPEDLEMLKGMRSKMLG